MKTPKSSTVAGLVASGAAVLAGGTVTANWLNDQTTSQPPTLSINTDDDDVDTTGTSILVNQDGRTVIHGDVVKTKTAFSIVRKELCWDRNAERRFKQLSVKEALGTISRKERDELADIDSLRERELGTTNGDEVLHQYRARQLTAALLHALKEYVHFFGTSSIERIAASSSAPSKAEKKSSQ